MKGLFLYPNVLFALWLVPLIGLAFYFSRRRNKQLLQRFAAEKLLAQLKPQISRQRVFWKYTCFLLGLVAVVLTLARPQWGEYYQQLRRKGRDLVVLLDLSKSMLAQDLAPSRLERAKLDLRDLLAALDGDRIGLVAFAGRPQVKCPLTLDYGFFQMVLEECSPGSVPLGGTMIGDAIRKALAMLRPHEKIPQAHGHNHQAILLITDGEDHDSFPLEAAQQAAKAGIPIFTIGLGDPHEGRRIPIKQHGQLAFMTYKGQQVWTRMNENLLREIALKTGGVYVPVRTRRVDLREIYQDYIRKIEAQEHLAVKRKRYLYERFQLFLFIAWVLLVVELLIPPVAPKTPARRPPSQALLLLAVLLCCQGGTVLAQSADELVRAGNRLWQAGQYQQALQKYQQAEVLRPEDPYILYNMGNACYRAQKWDKARQHYLQALRTKDGHLQELLHYNLACTHYRQASALMPRASDLKQIQRVVAYLRQSLAQLRAVLKLAPDNAKARHNLVLVKLHLKDFLDRLHQKEQQAREQARTAFVVLTAIRNGQRGLDRTLTQLAAQAPLQKYQKPQQTLAAQLPVFERKFKQELEQAAQGAGAKSSGRSKPRSNLVPPAQKKQLLDFVHGQVQQASQAMTAAAQALGQNERTALRSVHQARQIVERLWRLLAPPGVLLAEDLRLQQQALEHTKALPSQGAQARWASTRQEQDEARQLSLLLATKWQQQAQALAKSGSHPVPAGKKPLAPYAVARQAADQQQKALAALQASKAAAAQPHQQKALELLRQLAKQLGKTPQHQPRPSPQRQRAPQRQRSPQRQPQAQRKQERQKLAQQQARAILRQAKERERRHRQKRRARQGLVSGGRTIDDRDW